jgi:hypothetical protein
VFAGQHFRAGFHVEARQLDDARLNRWLDRWSPIIAGQLSAADQAPAMRRTCSVRRRTTV